MASFWHIDAGSVTVLMAVLATYYKVSVMHYQHKLMWRDFEKRHNMNGNRAITQGAGPAQKADSVG